MFQSAVEKTKVAPPSIPAMVEDPVRLVQLGLMSFVHNDISNLHQEDLQEDSGPHIHLNLQPLRLDRSQFPGDISQLTAWTRVKSTTTKSFLPVMEY